MKILLALFASCIIGLGQNYVPIYVPPSSGASAMPWVQTFVGATPANYGTITVGEKFTVGGSGITATQLGRYVFTGSTGVHILKLWDNSGTLLAAANLPTTGLTGLQYAAITPVSLTAGATYSISTFESSANNSDNMVGGVSPTLSADATFITTVFVNSSDAFPGSSSGASFPGVDFKYTKP